MVLKRTLTVSRFLTFGIFALIGLVVAYITLNSLKLIPPVFGAPNPAPLVIPSLREWHGDSGDFTLTGASRIAVDPASSALAATGATFASDLHAVTGKTLPVVTTSSPASGDFFLTLRNADQSLSSEGYTFTIGDFAVISANTPTGVFYGTRTALQILAQDAQHASIPKGTARDYPTYAERGFMLDVARKFFSLAYLEDTVRQMAWYKMNDFHIHFNDNEIDGGTHPDWQQRYAAFRLNSPVFPGLAAKDGSYTQQDMRALQDLAKQYAVTITPEIDMPAHDLALTQYRPDLASPVNKEFLDLNNPNTYAFVDNLWAAFLPWFDAKQIDIGADEYDTGDADNYRKFINREDAYLKARGRTVRLWGSLSEMRGPTAVNTDVTLDVWDTGWANPPEMAHDGYHVVNASGHLLYIVPKAGGYFPDALDTQLLYNQWEPYIFDLSHPALNLQPGDPHLLGGMFCEWNDRLGSNISDADVAVRVTPAMQTIGQKLWGGPNPPLAYAQFQQLARAVGAPPNTHLPQAAASAGTTGTTGAARTAPPSLLSHAETVSAAGVHRTPCHRCH
jgi:hexosaminidase